MRKKIILLSFFFASFISAFTQTDSTQSFKISGSVDGFYRYNFSDAPGHLNSNNFTSFTNGQNSFELGMASLKAEHSFGKVGALVDLGFGNRAEEFSYADDNTILALKQAFLTYAPNDNIKLTFGKWATHIGYELVDAIANRNYSMSYMFSYGPFTHTGIKADFTFDEFGFMVGIANPTDVTSAINAPTKTLLAQVSRSGDNFSAYLNYQGYFGAAVTKPSAKSLNQVGLTAIGTISDQFSIGYDGTVQMIKNSLDESLSWWGSALYLNFDPTDKFGLALRTEYFADEKDAVFFGADILQSTLSANFTVGDHLKFIPEVRFENASQEIFQKNDGSSSKNTFTGLVAAVYSF